MRTDFYIARTNNKMKEKVTLPRFKVGIDPDVKASGIAIWNIEHQKFTKLVCLPFFEAIELLRLNKPRIEVVVVSAGWLIKKTSWHGGKNAGIQAKIAERVGANHQVGLLFEEFCLRDDLPLRLSKPSGKVTHEYFMKFKKWNDTTNQETRDAAMLIIE